MKVWLLYSSYNDGSTYETQSYDHLIKIVDSEEKAKKWIFDSAINDCYERIRTYDDAQKLYNYDEVFRQTCADDIYYFDCQVNSYKPGEKEYVVKDPNGYESWIYYYDVREVE